jgi:hypothetical protein
MTKPVQRVSQLISTFGPGAMLDLPTRSVLVRGLEGWDVKGNAYRPIDEPRLSEFLEKALKEKSRFPEDKKLRLLAPPVLTSYDRGEIPGVEVTVFPTWFVCEQVEPIGSDASGRKGRRLVPWRDLRAEGGRRQFVNDEGKKVDVTPIRFVAACEQGHLQDIDWKWAVHGSEKCDRPMWVEERGTSADPANTSIVCGCGKSLSRTSISAGTPRPVQRAASACAKRTGRNLPGWQPAPSSHALRDEHLFPADRDGYLPAHRRR